MMNSKEIPLFDLDSSLEYVFVAGGGGSKEYGKDNGVLAVKKTEVGKKQPHGVQFFKTNDLILDIQVYSEKPKELCVLCNETELERAPRSLDEPIKEAEETIIPYDKVSSSSSEDEALIESIKAEKERKERERQPEPVNKHIRKPSKDLFVLAIGDDALYVLKFTNTFSLHCRLEQRVKQALLNKHLYVMFDNKFQGFFDIIKNPSAIKFQQEPLARITNSPVEEYVYRLYKKNSGIVPLNGTLTADIPDRWDGFFVSGGKVHKIVREKHSLTDEIVNVLVYNNKKYEVEGKLSPVVVHKGGIVFYSNQGKRGMLYFIGQDEKIYETSRITTMDVKGRLTVVVTTEGHAVLYVNGHYSSTTGLTNLPITGVGIDDSFMYTAHLNGKISKIRRISKLEKHLKKLGIVFLVVLVICLLFKRFFKHK